jgi:hypothetical protein
MTKRTSQDKQLHERRLDDTVADSFPASDPPAHPGTTGVRRHPAHSEEPDQRERPESHKRGHDARPTGHPTSDRHATETAHAWEDEEQSAS